MNKRTTTRAIIIGTTITAASILLHQKAFAQQKPIIEQPVQRSNPSHISLVSTLYAAEISEQQILNETNKNYIKDYAGVLTNEQASSLVSAISSLEKETSAEVAVVIIKSLDGKSVEEYAQDIFDNWKIGKAGKDNGLLILAAIEDRKVRIQTGYGLEGCLPDGVCGDIIREKIVPNFRGQDYYAGLKEAISAASGRIREESRPMTAEEKQRKAAEDKEAARRKAEEEKILGFVMLGALGSMLAAFGIYGLSTLIDRKRRHNKMKKLLKETEARLNSTKEEREKGITNLYRIIDDCQYEFEDVEKEATKVLVGVIEESARNYRVEDIKMFLNCSVRAARETAKKEYIKFLPHFIRTRSLDDIASIAEYDCKVGKEALDALIELKAVGYLEKHLNTPDKQTQKRIVEEMEPHIKKYIDNNNYEVLRAFVLLGSPVVKEKALKFLEKNAKHFADKKDERNLKFLKDNSNDATVSALVVAALVVIASESHHSHDDHHSSSSSSDSSSSFGGFGGGMSGGGGASGSW